MDGALPCNRLQLCVRPADLDSNTRPTGLRFVLMTLRLLEHWRSHLGVDTDSALIVLAALAITMEKFTRGEFGPEHRDVNMAIPPESLARCNVSSIAAATGMNRETARRKVLCLIGKGILIRDRHGWLRVSPDYTRLVPTGELIGCQLQSLLHTANGLLRDGILEAARA